MRISPAEVVTEERQGESEIRHEVDDEPVAQRGGNVLAGSFHPSSLRYDVSSVRTPIRFYGVASKVAAVTAAAR